MQKLFWGIVLVLAAGARGLQMLQKRGQAAGQQMIFYGRQARRTFRMVAAHLMLQASGMGDEGGLHDISPFRPRYALLYSKANTLGLQGPAI